MPALGFEDMIRRGAARMISADGDIGGRLPFYVFKCVGVLNNQYPIYGCGFISREEAEEAAQRTSGYVVAVRVRSFEVIKFLPREMPVVVTRYIYTKKDCPDKHYLYKIGREYRYFLSFLEMLKFLGFDIEAYRQAKSLPKSFQEEIMEEIEEFSL